MILLRKHIRKELELVKKQGERKREEQVIKKGVGGECAGVPTPRGAVSARDHEEVSNRARHGGYLEAEGGQFQYKFHREHTSKYNVHIVKDLSVLFSLTIKLQ